MCTNLKNNVFSGSRIDGLFAVFVFILSVFMVGCSSVAAATAVEPVEPIEDQPIVEPTVPAVVDTAVNQEVSRATAVELATETNSGITDEEAVALAFMREEEKLARDAYLFLYDLWGKNVFNNISASEQVHMDAILALMNQYELDDPVGGNAAGQFTDPALQSLYDQLVATGTQSLADALAVGAAIEEIDILDLEEYSAATTNPAILQVYVSLLAGSENHLRAFVPQLENQTGELYVPQYLSQEQYDAIMSATGNGQGGGSGSGGNGNGNGGNGGNDGNSNGGNGNGGGGRGNNGGKGGGRG